MRFNLPYGNQIKTFEYPKQRIKLVVKAKPLPAPQPEETLVREALAHPIDSAPLRELVRRDERVCIIAGDMTRAWVRHHRLVPALLDELNRGGISDDAINVIIATGDHRTQTPEEHRFLVGEEALARVSVFDHRARDSNAQTFLGTTTYGTPVRINRKVATADRVILTGGIVYHFLAGWGGGKKAVLPGVAAYETIKRNHALAFLPGEGEGLNPAVQAGRMKGNPCSDDMVQGTSMAGPDFLINTIINEETQQIARVVAGNYLTAHEAGCRFVEKHYGVPILDRAELVVVSCGGYPKDINFYQTYKTIYHAQFALQKGGTMLLLSESGEGSGNEDFARMFHLYTNNRDREAALRRDYTIGGHMAYHTAVMAAENDVLLLTDLPDRKVRQAGIIPVATLEEGLAFIRQKHGGLPDAYIMPYGGATFPRLV